jgi:uncharacterized protein (TIGR02679 family)
MSDEARLQRLLGGAQLLHLRRRLRARYERGAEQDAFTLNDLTAAERRALENLLGRPARSAGSMRVSRAELDATVARAGLAADLRAALEVLDGPLTDRRAQEAARQRAWRAALDSVAEPRLRALVAATPGAALLKRLAGGDADRGRALLERACRVLERLPAQGIPLAQLAAEALGDSHALDAGQPVAALVLRACRGSDASRGAPADRELAGGDGPSGERRREQWARIGVSVNELAAPVLCLNLRAHDGTPAGELAAVAAGLGQPVHLNLRALLASPPRWAVANATVYVCENPAVVAIAADRLGGRCAPLVCTDGMPAAAQQTLLRQLGERGAKLAYHGDFDWPGLRIGNFVIGSFGALPWRFGAADYRLGCTEGGLPLAKGERVAAVWDAALADALSERGVAVHEEAVAETLLRDLDI